MTVDEIKQLQETVETKTDHLEDLLALKIVIEEKVQVARMDIENLNDQIKEALLGS